jgi:hypothetical protein
VSDGVSFFPKMTDCEWVDSILEDQLVVESKNLLSHFLWRSKCHAHDCATCKRKHPGVLSSLSRRIEHAEAGLALEIDEIRADHLREASQIARQSILSRPADSIFALNDVLLLGYREWTEEQSSGETGPALLLMKSLAMAGRRVKQVFAAVHGEGLVWFDVVPDLSDSDEENARKECVSLVRHLTIESREFAFSAALAAELLPDMLYAQDPDPPKGVHLGVLYKVILAAARGYVQTYLEDTVPYDWPLDTPPAVESEPPQNAGPEQTPSKVKQADADKVEGVYEAQTLMMDIQTELLGKVGSLEAWRNSLGDLRNPEPSIEAQCEAAWRDALGAHFSELDEQTRSFLVQAECLFLRPRNKHDFTSAVLFLTKAFEFEFRRSVIAPLIDDLQPMVLNDSAFKGDLATFTLGRYQAFFQKHSLITTLLLDERLGLKHTNICNAIGRVNMHKDVKHSGTKSEAQAGNLRAAFLGKESPLKALLRT